MSELKGGLDLVSADPYCDCERADILDLIVFKPSSYFSSRNFLLSLLFCIYKNKNKSFDPRLSSLWSCLFPIFLFNLTINEKPSSPENCPAEFISQSFIGLLIIRSDKLKMFDKINVTGFQAFGDIECNPT